MNRSYNSPLAFFRESFFGKYVLPLILVVVLITGNVPFALALGNGPSTPEALNFSPLQPEQLVNTYTGDFSYSIPILNIGGYPIGLSYSSNPTMEEEASWVGLGWNMNIGTIQRQMKGLPDDFNNDTIIQENNMKPNITGKVTVSGLSGEIIGKKTNPNIGFDISYNNYNGFMFNLSANYNKIPLAPKTKNTENLLMANVGISFGSGGLNLSPSLYIESAANAKDLSSNGKFGFTFNMGSYTGMQVTAYQNITKLNRYFPGISQFSYSPLSFTPSSPLLYLNYSKSVTIKPTGLEGAFFTKSTAFTGMFSMQKLLSKIQYKPALGYLYIENKLGKENHLLDINTEKEVTYIPGLPHIPITYLEPDIFNVNVQSITGTYRAYKNTGMIVNGIHNIAGIGENSDIGLEFGSGNTLKYGVNPTKSFNINSSGTWLIKNKISAANYNLGNGFINCYFKKSGEVSRSFTPAYYQNIKEETPVGFHIEKQPGFKYKLTSNSISNANTSLSALTQTPKYTTLPEQTTAFVPFKYNVIKQHPYYIKWYKQYFNNIPVKDHHIAQVQITGDNGLKYVFGCPAYQHLQKEVAFSVAQKAPFGSFTQYDLTDATSNNSKGINHYFSSKTIPGYAYAYHLTEVYSADYSDLTGNGPTEDDYGNYILFHYIKKINKYKWRTPYSTTQNIANYNEGSFSLKDDNTANYVYGEKDIWYVDTIRTKDQIAIFYTSPRNDAYEAAGEHGGIGSRSMHKLDSLKLWNLQDYKHLGNQAPILKKAVFTYDYSLCAGVKNNNSGAGKLTLIKLEITDGQSLENKRSSYEFHYGEMPNGNVINRNYNPENIDRWGFHKTADTLGSLYPYTNQDNQTELTENAYNWNLTTIQLPIGATIKVEYEPDDYRYVQDKKAMRMFKLYCVGDNLNALPSSCSTNEVISKTNNVIYFKTDIPDSLSYQEAQQEFNKYFKENIPKQLYFKAKVNVNRTSVSSNYPNENKEYIYGFAEVHDKKLIKQGSQYYGAIQLKKVQHNSVFYHPFSFAAIQYSIANTPRYFNNLPMLPDNTMGGLITGFVNSVFSVVSFPNIVNSILAIAQGPIRNAYTNGIGKYINPEDSWIRLTVRDKKYGGGSRVKRVKYLNNWQTLTNEQGADVVYIKEYDYQTQDGLSSGVASYEPMVGGDEIPHRVAVTYENESGGLMSFTRKLMPVSKYMYYYPIGEMQYPGPSIGYSRVVEKTIRPSDGIVANGYTISTYYTAKDFPVKAHTTTKQEFTPKLNISLYFQKIYQQDAVVSEGFSIVLNDMAGKPKKVETFDGEGNVIKKMVYHYFLPGSKIPYYDKTNKLTEGYPGLETDITVALKEEMSVSTSFEIEPNIDGSVIPLIPSPVVLLSIYGKNTSIKTLYRSCSVSKVIYQSGQIKSVDILDRGANVSKQVIAYHPVGGSELITKTKDKFGYTYSYQLPGSYVYKQMGAASKNAGIGIKIITDNTGKILTGTSSLADGDRLIIPGNFTWVITDIAGNKYLIDKNGQPIPNININATIETSGYRNMFAQPIEQVACKKSPIVNNSISLTTNNRIISAGANTLIDYYSYPCDTCMYSCNPEGYVFDTILTPSFSSQLTIPSQQGQYLNTLIEPSPIDTTHYYSLIVTKPKRSFTSSHRLFLRKHTRTTTDWVKEIILPNGKNTRLVDWYVNKQGIFILKERIAPLNSTAHIPHSNNKMFPTCNGEPYLNGKELYLAYYNLNGTLIKSLRIDYQPPNNIVSLRQKKFIQKQATDIVAYQDNIIYIAGRVGLHIADATSDEASYIMKFDLSGNSTIKDISYYPEQKDIIELILDGNKLYGIGKTCRPMLAQKLLNVFRLDNQLNMLWSQETSLATVGAPKYNFANYSGVKTHMLDTNLLVVGLLQSGNQQHLTGFKLSPQGTFLTKHIWYYNIPELTGIYDIDSTQNLLLLTGHHNNGGKFIVMEQNLNILTTRNASTRLSGIAAQSIDNIAYTGKSLATPNVSDYYYTDINGAISGGCTEKDNDLVFSKQLSITPLNILKTDTTFSLRPVSTTENAVNFPKHTNCPPLQLHVEVQDACDCSGSINLVIKNKSNELTTEWVNLPSTAVTNSNGDYFGVNNLCPGTYGLVINDSLNNLSWPFTFTIGQTILDTSLNLVLNPFIHQLKNRWRASKQWVLDTLRSPYQINQQVQLNQQGDYAYYQPFWKFNTSTQTWYAQGENTPQWIPVDFTTYHDRFGNPAESRDIIGNYSASYFAYNGTLQEALAYNARSNEIGFDSYEDYYKNINSPVIKGHFRLKNVASQKISGKEHHTGLYALKLPIGEEVAYTTLIKHYQQGNPPPQVMPTVPFELQPGYCSDVFAPFDSTRTYLISVWLKVTENNYHKFGMSSGVTDFLTVAVDNTSLALKKVSESPEIDGWVQYKYEFELHAAVCNQLQIRLLNNLRSIKPIIYYFDDLKIEPKDALMKTYVYHPYRKLLMAELDENNYAVRYYYNYKDELEEVVKETEKGDLFIVYKKNRKVQK